MTNCAGASVTTTLEHIDCPSCGMSVPIENGRTADHRLPLHVDMARWDGCWIYRPRRVGDLRFYVGWIRSGSDMKESRAYIEAEWKRPCAFDLIDAPDNLVLPKLGSSMLDTQGRIDDDGIRVSWGGACPIQGDGYADGDRLFYRSRHNGFSVRISDWKYEENNFVSPDGGWLLAEESERIIRRCVAMWRMR